MPTSLSRRRSAVSNDSDEEKTSSRRGRRSSQDEEPEEKTSSRRGRRSSQDEEPEEETGGSRRSRRTTSEGKATGGFGAYSQKRKESSSFADEFKPEPGKETLFKILDEGPFDNYQQHWINEFKGSGKRLSYVCRDDEYFDDDDGCPLDDIGETSTTISLFNVLDLSNPRKPEVKVWRATVTIADILFRMAQEKRTSPLDREDLYFVVTVTKKPNKTTYQIEPVKARDLEDDFDMKPLEDDEIQDFLDDRFKDRTAVTQVDTYEDLEKIAEEIG